MGRNEIWFEYDGQLTAIGDALVAAGLIHAYELDSENRYAWLIGAISLDASLQLNVNHVHEHVADCDDKRVRIFLVEVDSAAFDLSEQNLMLKQIGSYLSDQLGVDVVYGQVTHRGGDEFEYCAIERV